MKNNLLFTLLFAVFAAVFICDIAFSDSNGMNRHSGSADENTCSESGCHGAGNGNSTTGGLPDNGGPGSITLSCSNMPGWIYTPGTVYHMTLTLTQLGCQHFGYSALALNGGMANSGSMTVTDVPHTQKQTPFGNTRQYMTHRSPTNGGVFFTTNPAVINFDWTAPANNEGNVTMYYDGVAANNNQLDDAGDNVYKGTQVFTPNTSVSSPMLLTSANNQTLRAITSIPSNPFRFYVEGLGLTNNVTVSTMSPFEISNNSTSGFGTSPITLSQLSGTVTTTPLYVRYNAFLSGSTTGTITVSSTGATSKTATMTGQIAAPAINTPSVTSIPQFTTLVGAPSNIDSFTVTFSGLMDSIIFTAPSNFQVTTNSTRDWSTKCFWVPFNPIWGLNNFKVYVRYNPSVAGTHNGNVIISTLGGSSQTVGVSGIGSGTTGIENILSEGSVQIFPNPIDRKGEIIFSLSEKQFLKVDVYSVNGEKIIDLTERQYNKGTNKISFDVSDIIPGIYFMVLENENNKIVKRIVLEK